MSSKFTLSVIIKAVDHLTAPMGAMVSGLKRHAASLKKIGAQTQAVGRRMTTMITAPATIFAGLSIKKVFEFQKSMNMVRSIAASTGEEYINLEKLARKMGATTQFTATDAAEAMRFMARTGMKYKQIMEGLPYVLQLAASAQIDMATAADITTNIIHGYGMETKDLAKVNDILVNAFINANVDLQMLGHSFKYVGPVAHGFKLDMETTGAAIAFLGDAGIQASMAGTAMRGMLQRLASPSNKARKIMDHFKISIKKTKDGAVDFIDALEQFEKSKMPGWMMTEIVGLRPGPAMQALIDRGVGPLKKLIEELHKAGTAARVAEGNMKGLPGGFYLMISGFESLQLSLFRSTNAIEDFFRWFGALMQKMSEADPKILRLTLVIGGLAAVVGPLAVAIGTTLSVLAALGAGGVALIGTIGFVAAAIVVLGVGAYLLIKHWTKVKTFFSELWPAIKDQAQRTFEAIKIMGLTFAINMVKILRAPLQWMGRDTKVLNKYIDDMTGKRDELMGREKRREDRKLYLKYLRSDFRYMIPQEDFSLAGGSLIGKRMRNLAGEVNPYVRKPVSFLSSPNPVQLTKSQNEIVIKVAKEEGTQAKIFKVTGDAGLTVHNQAYVGAH